MSKNILLNRLKDEKILIFKNNTKRSDFLIGFNMNWMLDCYHNIQRIADCSDATKQNAWIQFKKFIDYILGHGKRYYRLPYLQIASTTGQAIPLKKDKVEINSLSLKECVQLLEFLEKNALERDELACRLFLYSGFAPMNIKDPSLLHKQSSIFNDRLLNIKIEDIDFNNSMINLVNTQPIICSSSYLKRLRALAGMRRKGFIFTTSNNTIKPISINQIKRILQQASISLSWRRSISLKSLKLTAFRLAEQLIRF